MQMLRFAGTVGTHMHVRTSNTYIDHLRDDKYLIMIDEMKTAMNDIEGLKKYAIDYLASSTWCVRYESI